MSDNEKEEQIHIMSSELHHCSDVDANKDIENNTSKIDEYESWSPVKKQLWDERREKPNNFFYKNKLPGERIIKGHWSDAEKAFFVKKLRETDLVNIKWGLFSRDIPGRVGCQCRAFFRKLYETGELRTLAPDLVIPPLRKDTKMKLQKNMPKSLFEIYNLEFGRSNSYKFPDVENKQEFQDSLKSSLEGTHKELFLSGAALYY